MRNDNSSSFNRDPDIEEGELQPNNNIIGAKVFFCTLKKIAKKRT